MVSTHGVDDVVLLHLLGGGGAVAGRAARVVRTHEVDLVVHVHVDDVVVVARLEPAERNRKNTFISMRKVKRVYSVHAAACHWCDSAQRDRYLHETE